MPPAGESATVGDALRVAAGALGPALVTPPARQRLFEAGDLIPLSSGGGIECRLGDPDCADLAVRFLAAETATDQLLDAPLAIAGDTGAAVAGLARRWRAQVETPPDARILWLELDLRARTAPSPSVFAGPGNPPWGPPANAPDDNEWAAIIDVLRPGWPAPIIAHLRAALPSTAWVGYVGIMRGRELRATVSGLAADAVPTLLQRLGWPGDWRALDLVLAAMYARGPRLTLGLDLTDGVGPALGIELGPRDPDGWERLLAAAALLTPISDAAHAALLAWPGKSAVDPGWPDRLRERAACIVRRLNHLKFGIDGGSPLRLKAYLYFGLLP